MGGRERINGSECVRRNGRIVSYEDMWVSVWTVVQPHLWSYSVVEAIDNSIQ